MGAGLFAGACKRLGWARRLLAFNFRAEAAREIAAGESLGARLLINRESAFPRQLAAIDGPPPLIWA